MGGNRKVACAPVVAALTLFGPISGAQTLNLGPVPAPSQNTSDALAARFVAELEASTSDRERALVRLASRLARTNDPIDELAARTIARHLDTLRRALRDAERTTRDGAADPVRRQRLREALARVDLLIASTPGSSADDRLVEDAAEDLLSAIGVVAREVEGATTAMPASLREAGTVTPDTDALRATIRSLGEPYDASGTRLLELLDLIENVRSVPSLEARASRGLNSIAGVVRFTQLDTERFIARSMLNRLPRTLERCLFEAQ